MASDVAPEVAIRCDDLSIARQNAHRRVVDGVSFAVASGGVIAVMGPTGAGKSSLAAVLAGAETTSLAVVGGSAHVLGVPVRRPGRAYRELIARTGYLPQGAGASLPPRLTVAEIVSEPVTTRYPRVGRKNRELAVAALLDELHLPLGAAAKYPYELSSGMRQRVALARALVVEPQVLVADEPYVNLDVAARHAARDAIVRRRDEGMAVLVVVNDDAAVAELDADVLVLQAGCPVAVGHATGELLWTPGASARSAS